MTKSITIELPDTFIVSSDTNNYAYEAFTEKWTPDYVQYLCEGYIGVLVQRASASKTKKAGYTEKERTEARLAQMAKINSASFTRTSSGLTVADKALIAAMLAQGKDWSDKFAIKRIKTGEFNTKGIEKTKAEAVDVAWRRFCAYFFAKKEVEDTDARRKKLKGRLVASDAYINAHAAELALIAAKAKAKGTVAKAADTLGDDWDEDDDDTTEE